MKRNKIVNQKLIRWSIVLVIVLLGAGLLWLIYWGLIDPSIEKYTRPLATPINSVSYYEDGSYLALPDGKAFGDAIDAFTFLDSGEVTDFYYIDNSNKDNPIYGKIADTYEIEIQYDTESFAQVKDLIIQAGERNGNIAYYSYYLLPYEDSCYKLFAFHEEKKIVRFIMITDIDENIAVSSYLRGYTHLDWN